MALENFLKRKTMEINQKATNEIQIMEFVINKIINENYNKIKETFHPTIEKSYNLVLNYIDHNKKEEFIEKKHILKKNYMKEF